MFQLSKDGPFSFLWTIHVFIKEQSPPLMGPQLYVPYQSPLPRIWRIWRRSWRLRQRGWWIQVLQVQQVLWKINLAVQRNPLFHRRGYHLNLIYLFSPGLVTLLASAGRKKIGATSATVTSWTELMKVQGDFLSTPPSPWILSVGF